MRCGKCQTPGTGHRPMDHGFVGRRSQGGWPAAPLHPPEGAEAFMPVRFRYCIRLGSQSDSCGNATMMQSAATSISMNHQIPLKIL